MNKIIWVVAFFSLTHCKTNDLDQIGHQPTFARSAIDTTILQQERIYRGDTMITFITMVGDTTIERKTSRYSSNAESEIMDLGVRKRSSAKETSGSVMYEDMSTTPMTTSALPPKGRIRPNLPENPDAGQITAGEWNDLNNWKDWQNLLNDNNYSEMQNHWGIYPTSRYSVFVTNENNIPLVDRQVELISGNKVIWTARTDNAGKAELWNEYYGNHHFRKTALFAKVYNNTSSYNLNVGLQKTANLIINNACNTLDKVEIMFVVDATGSMGDEINYLKSELKDVIKKSTQAQRKIDLKIGSVFYRDGNDAYLTKVSPLSKNFDRVYNFIDEQRAAGGGDFPEAVDAALEEALAQKWSENAAARIIFLLLDAPPHEDNQIKTTVADQIKEAAELGIKIIPISASGINRETEFLLKFMSVLTNGTYVFITDDSGIGNPHLDPLVNDFEVEKLNDLLIRLITNYTNLKKCDDKIKPNNNIRIYPNPTSNYITVETKIPLKEVRIIANSGKVVLREKEVTNQTQIDLSFLVDGVYTVQCIGSDFQYSYPVILVSD